LASTWAASTVNGASMGGAASSARPPSSLASGGAASMPASPGSHGVPSFGARGVGVSMRQSAATTFTSAMRASAKPPGGAPADVSSPSAKRS
jgi:hypothetical protein